ncbi:Uncharacterised protein [Serratia marcescens]|uniref:hypothetical protein n=1 Tax=Serratia marcescens TaxID=615 RepID=UPI00217C1D9E|nr:hypothetical protein [Serratia marcescens]CAI1824573.1 Uncharacterised protein [Serratia marcescens]
MNQTIPTSLSKLKTLLLVPAALMGGLTFSHVSIGAEVTDLTTIAAEGWSTPVKESYSNFQCGENSVLIGRQHSGDENGTTLYQCAKTNLKIESITTSEQMRESSGVNYVCPDNQVMVGRKHDGDEDGYTSYTCGKAYTKTEQPVKVVKGSWSKEQKESRSSFTCPTNQVMIGRVHTSDENGDTRYLCGTLTL